MTPGAFLTYMGLGLAALGGWLWHESGPPPAGAVAAAIPTDLDAIAAWPQAAQGADLKAVVVLGPAAGSWQVAMDDTSLARTPGVAVVDARGGSLADGIAEAARRLRDAGRIGTTRPRIVAAGGCSAETAAGELHALRAVVHGLVSRTPIDLIAFGLDGDLNCPLHLPSRTTYVTASGDYALAARLAAATTIEDPMALAFVLEMGTHP